MRHLRDLRVDCVQMGFPPIYFPFVDNFSRGNCRRSHHSLSGSTAEILLLWNLVNDRSAQPVDGVYSADALSQMQPLRILLRNRYAGGQRANNPPAEAQQRLPGDPFPQKPTILIRTPVALVFLAEKCGYLKQQSLCQ